LHSRAMILLTGGTEFIRAEAEQREALLQEVRQTAGKSLSAEEINTHFATLPPRYFQVRTAREIIDDLELVHRFMRRLVLEDERVLSPVIAWRDEADRGYNAVKICTWDRAGLFSKIAGSLSAAGLNILGAQIFTRTDSIVLDTFYVNDGRTGHLATRQQHDQFAELLENVLTDEDIDLPALIKRQITQQPVYQPYTGEHIPTQIHIDNEVSETRTLIEVETEDHLGLLYMISQTLSKLAVDIVNARIVTERGAAIDSFYVCELSGGKITSPERQAAIERRLREAIQRLRAAA
jgi:[protein-PII] uridylyltransferase